jgi:glutamate racemase
MQDSIGIFDSGLGGLTVLKSLARHFPQESFCYVGDIARLPYGNKSPETIRKYGDQVLDFLHRQQVKALVIACNSASTMYLGEKDFKGIPLLNVIEPGCRAALEAASDDKIAVLGTSATIRSGAYARILKQLRPQVEVLEQACPLFVPLVEEGMLNDEVTQTIARRYLTHICQQRFKTVILGCTHYPLLRQDLLQVLEPGTQLVESGDVLARELQQLFASGQLPAAHGPSRSLKVQITDLTDHFERLALQLMSPESIGVLEKIVL